VTTPVWFVQEDGWILVETQVRAVAEVLPESEIGAAEQLIKRKYRADLLIIGRLRFVQSALHLGHARTKPVILAITPTHIW
jgi:hypothetical protein